MNIVDPLGKTGYQIVLNMCTRVSWSLNGNIIWKHGDPVLSRRG